MSVINNVLKDLENKPSAFTPLDVHVVETQQASNTNIRYILIVSFAAVIAVAMLLFFQSDYFHHSQTTPLPLTQPEQVKPALTEGKIEQKVDESSTLLPEELNMASKIERNTETPAILPEIQGMQINETKDFLELSLQLSQQAQSHLQARNDNRYKFLISNTQSLISAPELENNPWLHNLRFTQTELGVEVQFETVKGVLVETDHRLASDKYNWLIRLKKSIQEAAVKPRQPMPRQEANSTAVNARVTAPKSLVRGAPVEAVKEPVKPLVKLEIKPAKSKPSVHKTLSSAIDLMKEKNWVASEKLLLELIGTEVDKAARINLIKLYRLSQETTQMQQMMSVSLGLYPRDMELKVLHAQKLFSDKQYRSLVGQYQNLNSNLTLLSLTAASYQRLDQHGMAVDKYQQALKLDPQQPKNWISLGISLEHEKSIAAAKDAYQMAMHSGRLNQRLQEFTQQRIQKLSGL